MQDIEKLLYNVQKPARYIGGEINSIVKKHNKDITTFAFCFPDTYEIGMSNLGMKILYHAVNEHAHLCCERVYAPWEDMEEQMKKHNIPLFSLETKTPLKEFDIVGFTLQTELSYTSILHMLDLSGIPLLSKNRASLFPLVVAGGSCAYNPEPMADFIDLFIIGEGEEVNIELMELVAKFKKGGGAKEELLKAAAEITGIYVPAFGTEKVIQKRIVADLDKATYPEKFIVPFCDIVHNRLMIEVFRGCGRGCRFCQAGFIYRPIREKSPETLEKQAKALVDSTGYDEISLLSLSTSDYTHLHELTDNLLLWCEGQGVSLSLPSLRVDNFSVELLSKVQKVRKGGLTFAPEAGTQRLRDIINKNVTEQQLYETCAVAFKNGYTSLKLYFMIGLPGETDEDDLGIASLAQKMLDCYYENRPEGKSKAVNISVSVSSFVPKPFTPFQWAAQDSMEELERKQKLLRSAIKSNKISLHWHEKKVSFLEAVFARGDRSLGNVIERAYKTGAKFDNWEQYFNFENWMSAFEYCGVDPHNFTEEKAADSPLPWDHIDIGIPKKYFAKEFARSKITQTSGNCMEGCGGCGANRFLEGDCYAKC